MQGKPLSPLCQVWVHVSLRVAKQQMGGIPAWMHLLSKWKQRYGIGHAENKGEKRNNKNGKIWNMQFSKWEKSSVKKERVSSTAYMLCWYAGGVEEEGGYWKDKREEAELMNPGESDQFCMRRRKIRVSGLQSCASEIVSWESYRHGGEIWTGYKGSSVNKCLVESVLMNSLVPGWRVCTCTPKDFVPGPVLSGFFLIQCPS